MRRSTWSTVRSWLGCGGVFQPGHHQPCVATWSALSLRESAGHVPVRWGRVWLRCRSLRALHVGHRVVCVVVPQSRQGFGMVGRLLGMDDTPVVDEPVKTDAPLFGTLLVPAVTERCVHVHVSHAAIEDR